MEELLGGGGRTLDLGLGFGREGGATPRLEKGGSKDKRRVCEGVGGEGLGGEGWAGGTGGREGKGVT